MEIWNRRNPVGGAPIVDSALDVNSEHCVQNKVVAEAISTINSTLEQLGTDIKNGTEGVKYVEIGKIVLVNIRQKTLTEGASLGIPVASTNRAITLRNESVGGIAITTVSGSGTIVSGAGQINFTAGQAYSGDFIYLKA